MKTGNGRAGVGGLLTLPTHIIADSIDGLRPPNNQSWPTTEVPRTIPLFAYFADRPQPTTQTTY